ncbi:MAG: phosphatase PAP2 family protein [Candidatus Falkowbacteria bacterium]
MINNLDQQLYLFLAENRNDFWTAVFSSFSFLGNWQFIVVTMLAIIIFLIIKKKLYFIAPLILSVISSETITFWGKWYFNRPRPLVSVFVETGFSFPSGHATIAVAFYVFLAFMFLRLNKGKYSIWVYSFAVFIALMIGFSRLYLGAHYLSDVLVGYVVGFLGVMAGVRLADKLKSRKGVL